jgi:putative addiction module killer protein
MTIEMVLNDLSLRSPVSERGRARELMTELIEVLSTAKLYGVKVLRTQEDLYNLILSPDYPVASWLNDSQVEREERSFFLRQLDTKTPLLAEIEDIIIHEEGTSADFTWQGERAYGLGIAFLLKALVISFHSEPKWNCSSLELEITRIENKTVSDEINAELTLVTVTESLIHASRRENILVHKSEIEHRLRSEDWHPQDLLLSCYVTSDGKTPMLMWLESLSDRLAKEIIQARLNQVKQGSLGDHKSVGEGVWELRIFHGPGYRIYFGQVTTNQRLLLYGGDKGTQVEDIIKAKQYWKNYKQST